MNHSKIINVVSQHLGAIFPAYAAFYKPFLLHLRDDRDVLLQVSGQRDRSCANRKELRRRRRRLLLLAENAQLNSECLEASMARNVVGDYSFKPEIAEKCFLYQTASEQFVDEDDAYRISYMARRDPKPYNLLRRPQKGSSTTSSAPGPPRKTKATRTIPTRTGKSCSRSAKPPAAA